MASGRSPGLGADPVGRLLADAVLAGDARVPEEPGGLRQAGRDARGGRATPGCRPGRCRPGRGQHVRLHRGGPAGVDRDRPGPVRCPQARCPSGRDRLPGGALWRRAGRGLARGGPGGRVRRAGHAGGRRGRPAAVPSFDLLNLPRPPRPGPVGVRQGGRGLRPQMRVLCHPVLPGPPAVPGRGDILAEVDVAPGRGGRAGRPGSGVVRPGHWGGRRATSSPW